MFDKQIPSNTNLGKSDVVVVSAVFTEQRIKTECKNRDLPAVVPNFSESCCGKLDNTASAKNQGKEGTALGYTPPERHFVSFSHSSPKISV